MYLWIRQSLVSGILLVQAIASLMPTPAMPTPDPWCARSNCHCVQFAPLTAPAPAASETHATSAVTYVTCLPLLLACYEMPQPPSLRTRQAAHAKKILSSRVHWPITEVVAPNRQHGTRQARRTVKASRPLPPMLQRSQAPKKAFPSLKGCKSPVLLPSSFRKPRH